LHLTFHKGCANEIEYIGKCLNLDITTWFIPNSPAMSFDPLAKGNALYNIGHDRAQRIWNKHKNFFNQFDAIITSDTAPLSRIFLQNVFKKPLIIWICNRFDYRDTASLDCKFPDIEYYTLINRASKQKNVRVICYTPFEYIYAKHQNVTLSNFVIKSSGGYESKPFRSAIPSHIKKNDTFFIPTYCNDQVFNVEQKCNFLGIKCYMGRYNGPDDLKEFKGIIHLPYGWSNLALFENMQNGLIYFIPTKNFINKLRSKKHYHYQNAYHFFNLNENRYSEWYCPEHKDLFVYFDSWQDLKHKIESTNYQELSKKIILFGEKHKYKMIEKWKLVFNNLKIT